MAWTFEGYLETVNGMTGEVIAEYGDIEHDVKSPEQCQITLLSTEHEVANLALRAAEAWDYAQMWADRSGRPVRLHISGDISDGDSTTNGNWGVKTFLPRIKGGEEKEVPLPAKSAFSHKPAISMALDQSEYGKWQVPYGKGEEELAQRRLPEANVSTNGLVVRVLVLTEFGDQAEWDERFPTRQVKVVNKWVDMERELTNPHFCYNPVVFESFDNALRIHLGLGRRF